MKSAVSFKSNQAVVVNNNVWTALCLAFIWNVSQATHRVQRLLGAITSSFQELAKRQLYASYYVDKYFFCQNVSRWMAPNCSPFPLSEACKPTLERQKIQQICTTYCVLMFTSMWIPVSLYNKSNLHFNDLMPTFGCQFLVRMKTGRVMTVQWYD